MPVIVPWVQELLHPLVGDSMLELGNKRNTHGVFKTHFEALGFRHVSVDLNGRDGALALDLMQPLQLGQFDMVTNFGTSEHVERQEPCWRNIVEAAGNTIISTTPLPGEWAVHGRWYPTQDFYIALAALNGFEVERLYVGGLKAGRLNMCARLVRKSSPPFVMPPAALIFDNGDHGVGMAP